MQPEALIQTAVEAPIVLFHISVVWCILWRMMKKTGALRSDFYKLYVAKSCCDIVVYMSVGSSGFHNVPHIRMFL